MRELVHIFTRYSWAVADERLGPDQHLVQNNSDLPEIALLETGGIRVLYLVNLLISRLHNYLQQLGSQVGVIRHQALLLGCQVEGGETEIRQLDIQGLANDNIFCFQVPVRDRA